MNRLKNIDTINVIFIAVLYVLIIVFNGCDASQSDDWAIDNAFGDLIKTCGSGYTMVYSNDKIRPLDPNTKISINQYENGDKDACVVTGKAIVIRGIK